MTKNSKSKKPSTTDKLAAIEPIITLLAVAGGVLTVFGMGNPLEGIITGAIASGVVLIAATGAITRIYTNRDVLIDTITEIFKKGR